METPETAKKAFDTVLEMFQQRGYEISEQDDERILAMKPDSTYICAFVPRICTKFNVDQLQHFLSMTKQMGLAHCLIVYKDSATAPARKIVDLVPDIKIELFLEDELQYNPTKHILVPEHVLYAKKGTKKAKQQDWSAYPVISRLDPISRFLGFERGDIIKITRHNGLVIFRVVK